jgi:hypothetical protein
MMIQSEQGAQCPQQDQHMHSAHMHMHSAHAQCTCTVHMHSAHNRTSTCTTRSTDSRHVTGFRKPTDKP